MTNPRIRPLPFRAAALVVAGVATVAALLVSGCSPHGAQAAEQQQAPTSPPVSVAEVLQQDITDFREFTGRVEAVERVELRPRVSGYIESVRFHEGAQVRKGDVLFIIDPRPYDAALKRARAELARARSAHTQAQSERERAVRLLELRAFSQEEFDARTAGSERATADVQAAQAAVDAAALDLSFTQLRAPISGIVGKAEITAGNFVSAGETLLTRLVSVDPVYVRFEGDEAAYLRQAQHVRSQGGAAIQKVWVGLADEQGYPHQGELVFTDNELDPATGTISARARLDNPDRRFTPGLFARVKLGQGASYAAVLIKDSAIGTDQSRRFVYVVNGDNTVEYRTVDTGALFDGLRVVKSGLAPGDVIVVNGLQRVRPGAAISPERVAMRDDTAVSSEAMVAARGAGRAQ